jgi:hypothetical protein
MKEWHVRAGQRYYPKRVQLQVALYFLAHCPTLRTMSEKFGMPHNSISRCCIHRGVTGIVAGLVSCRHTKKIRWPRTDVALLATCDRFQTKYGLPGCMGAIDGSVIPMKKPTHEQAGGDADAYWNYKGHPATLLLAVVNADMLFT